MIHVYTGEAKGKTTAAMGLALRSAGRGFSVVIAQFFKDDCGEKISFQKHDNVSYFQFRHPGSFFKSYNDDERAGLKNAFSEFWAGIQEFIACNKVDLLVLDEFAYVLSMNLYRLDVFLEFLDSRQEHFELVLTGRDFPDEIISRADYVTNMQLVKHPFVSRRALARAGIEY